MFSINKNVSRSACNISTVEKKKNQLLRRDSSVSGRSRFTRESKKQLSFFAFFITEEIITISSFFISDV